ncbi:hypothetical protein DSO57_1020031 [Entomophthora muscae]|uniref:Uncharacterized protein n=1 Tax=Entomophthora muscae TaxID=34485 RepID=A0ACC2RIF0_9FUNG|nr:hypothetical protein DSO57_1020031 [Entomophthora muscae]
MVSIVTFISAAALSQQLAPQFWEDLSEEFKDFVGMIRFKEIGNTCAGIFESESAMIVPATCMRTNRTPIVVRTPRDEEAKSLHFDFLVKHITKHLRWTPENRYVYNRDPRPFWR